MSDGKLNISAELHRNKQLTAWTNKPANPAFAWRGIENARKAVIMAVFWQWLGTAAS
jgi:hypothetical protein